MEALAISAANLNIIEDNLGAVAKELNGVVSNVNYMNDHVAEVETKVESLNNEIQNMMHEIRENTIITNARQSIMYNNQEIEKKFGYFDNVRRVTLSLLDAVKYSSIHQNTLKKLREDILLNNPNYWLTNALASLTSWVLDDKQNTYKELNNALRLDEEKTSIFFTLINIKLGRHDTAINWLNKYLSLQNPTNLSKDFVNILDLVASGIFGDEEKRTVLNKIKEWQRDLNSNQEIMDKQINTWISYIEEQETNNMAFHYLPISTKDFNVLNDNIFITSSYKKVLNRFQNIFTSTPSNKKVDEILKTLIYEYEEQEQIYQEDNFRNSLLIECNGNREEANKLYQKQKDVFNKKRDIISLLTNIAIYPEQYKVSNETQKIALTLVKEHIKAAYVEINKHIKNNDIELSFGDFTTTTKDGSNYLEATKQLDTYLSNIYDIEDKNLLLLLIFIDIVGLLSIFLTLNIPILTGILVIILIVANILILKNISNKQKVRKLEKQRKKEVLSISLEKVFAEITDYSNTLKENQLQYNNLEAYLNNLNVEDYIKNNEERNIIV